MSDVIVVGAGCMGVATAHHLLEADPSLSVTVLERDPTLRYSSTVLSDGNVRVQFNLEENIRISRYAMEVLADFGEAMEVNGYRPEVAMRKQGNLFLVDEENEAAAQAGLELQRELGCDVRWLDIAEVVGAYPPLTSDRLVGGTLGPRDGSVDPNAIIEGYRRAAAARGARFVTGEVASISVEGERVTGVILTDGTRRGADVVTVCAGAWSTKLLATAGVTIPVAPVMRTVYVVSTDVGRGVRMPSAFLPSGLYLIPEHDGTFLMAWSRDDDPVGFDFTPADRSRFYDIIWPELVDWLPAFDSLEVVRSWAGLYEQNLLDANGIIGEWPDIDGLYQATGFSGHGFQQCHAVGRYLADLLTGRQPFMDLSRLGPERIVAGKPLLEHAGRII
ncbi:MAG: NAD(P)/FAD-dependent oxidoreductase [Acidimicrobiia bacterium]